MMRSLPTIAALGLVMVLGGCAAQSATGSSDPTTAAPGTEPLPDMTREVGEGMSLTGTVAGDAALEGGCVWVETDQGRIVAQPADGAAFSVDRDALAYVGADGTPIAGVGDQVRITGEPAPDTMTFCMTGEVWTVSAIEPA